MLRNGLQEEKRILQQGEHYPFDLQFGSRENTDEVKELRRQVKNAIGHYYSLDTDALDDAVSDLNAALKLTNKPHRIAEPLPNTTDYYLLKFDNGVMARLDVFDEYHGRGESSQGISVDHFLLKQDTTAAELIATIKWISKIVM